MEHTLHGWLLYHPIRITDHGGSLRRVGVGDFGAATEFGYGRALLWVLERWLLTEFDVALKTPHDVVRLDERGPDRCSLEGAVPRNQVVRKHVRQGTT